MSISYSKDKPKTHDKEGFEALGFTALSKDYGVKICQILGVDPRTVEKVDIRFEHGNFVTATVVMPLSDEQTGKVIQLAGEAKRHGA